MSMFGFGGDDDQQPQDRPRGAPPLHSEKIVGERKTFFLDLKENDRGRFIKITEDVRGRRDTIMLPVEMLRDFIEALQRIDEADANTASGGRVEDRQNAE